MSGCRSGIASGTASGLRAARGLVLLVALLALVAAPHARAFEYLDGRIQVHGFYEAQVRGISADFSEHFDLTQWYNVLNVEIDFEIAPDGWGPFDSFTGFTILEVRYDCVWTRACALSEGTNNFGNRSRFLPTRLDQSLDPRLSGAARYQDVIYRQPSGEIQTQKIYPAEPPFGIRTDTYRGLNQTSPFSALLDTRAALPMFGPAGGPIVDYVPGRYTFEKYLDYGFALRRIRGGNDGIGTQAMPWDPKDNIDPMAFLADRVNPFRPGDVNPVVGISGQSLPYRPGPNFAPLQGPYDQAKGLYMPSAPYADFIRDGGTDRFDQNFTQSRLAWNIGASQQQTWFVKEAYLDMDMLEGRLFIRAGRQTIVWGKTELFATTDLFNPRDLALGSLVSLEESRIPVWALRAIYSFYEVGPFQDVRLEAAVHLDEFYPTDLGRCGEPYTPNPVCNKTFGLLVHGAAGLAIAGEKRPGMWWENAKNLQFGARLEFRWERFSFALVDFWSYIQLPYADRLTTYERNVDPSTGRPRRMGASGACTTGAEPSCLQPGNDALVNSALNQQVYAVICSSSVGFSTLDPTVCAQSVFTSQAFSALPFASTTQLISLIASGSPQGIATVSNPAFLGTAGRIPTVALSIDPADAAKNGSVATGGPSGFFSPFALNPATNFALPGFAANHNQFQTLAQVLSVEQQAILGCGPFYNTTCDGGANQLDATPAAGGIDLLNAEASALVQSWIGIEGTPIEGFLATDTSRPQPGTVGFQGGPVCTRVVGGEVVILPGCRGPGDPGYDPAVDGGDPSAVSIGFPAGIGPVPALGNAALGPIAFTQGHPFTGQTWKSEMAAFSWNFQALLVAFSTSINDPTAPGDPGSDPALRLDPSRPYRTDGCSFVVPWKCSAVRAFWGILGTTRNNLLAGGNARFGRRDFAWAQGGEVVLRYQKRNVLGFSLDFAEDVSKTNWGVEFTWTRMNPFTNNDVFSGISKEDQFNLTVSVDRPTFVNFLNASRTFFFNSQWFFSYVPGFNKGFTNNGPWNVFFTFTVQTGYFQDRLLPGMTWVYDVQSNSGAALPQVSYRFNEAFTATFGVALFWGRYQEKAFPLNPVAPSNQVQRFSYATWAQNGLSVIRDRDEAFIRLRYTF